MSKRGVGNTALGAAVCRLIEQSEPDRTRLFQDPIVADLVGVPLRQLMKLGAMRRLILRKTDEITPGIYGLQVCRTRYIDDVVSAALSEGIRQLLILGAGYDTRPYRLASAREVRPFEIDLAAVQEDKQKKLRRHRHPSGDVTFVPIDFDSQTLESVLAGTAFDAARPAAVIWEGVTQYISEEAVRRTLAFVGRLPAGSVLVFTYVLKSVVERRSGIPGATELVDRLAKHAPWVFGLEPSDVKSFLEPFRLEVRADVGNADYQRMYLRPLGRELVVSEIERIVQARITG